jgi:hypothetical protein
VQGWFHPELEENEEWGFMSHHYVLPTADRAGFAWITDTTAFFGPGNVSDVEKIRRSETVACSVWGDFAALTICEEFLRRVESDKTVVESDESVRCCIQQIAKETAPAPGKNESRGLIVAVLERPVRLYLAYLGAHPNVSPCLGRIVAGDFDNPGNLFPVYYYERSLKTISECVLVGVHGMRIAHELNSRAIGKPNVWVFHNGVFGRVPEETLTRYINLSASLDVTILESFITTPGPFIGS